MDYRHFRVRQVSLYYTNIVCLILTLIIVGAIKRSVRVNKNLFFFIKSFINQYEIHQVIVDSHGNIYL
jgi:hypothetical protein